MHINTKVVFEWDDKAQEYRETSSEGYEYDGEMMLMQEAEIAAMEAGETDP